MTNDFEEKKKEVTDMLSLVQKLLDTFPEPNKQKIFLYLKKSEKILKEFKNDKILDMIRNIEVNAERVLESEIINAEKKILLIEEITNLKKMVYFYNKYQ